MTGLLSNGVSINAGRHLTVKLYVTQISRKDEHFNNNIFDFKRFHSEQDCYNEKLNRYLLKNHNLSYFKNHEYKYFNSPKKEVQEAFFDRASYYKKYMNIPQSVKKNFQKTCLHNKNTGRYIFTVQTVESSFKKKDIKKFTVKTNRIVRKYYQKKNWSSVDIEEIIKNKSYELDSICMEKLTRKFGTYQHALRKRVHITLTYGDSKISFKKFENMRNIYGFISDFGGVTGMTNGMSIITLIEIGETFFLLMFTWWKFKVNDVTSSVN
ncbi:hypothetical protein SNEBB_006070 [Seison nebaliae]|nr:hypothetical protein SNEBB_006070 [Seison nebaliae]